MQLTASRIQISTALNSIDGASVHSVWPNKLSGPSIIYQRTNTHDGSVYGTGEGAMDTQLQYTVYVIAKSLLETEEMSDKVIAKMKSIGYALAMSNNSDPNQITMIFNMTIDNVTQIASGRR